MGKFFDGTIWKVTLLKLTYIHQILLFSKWNTCYHLISIFLWNWKDDCMFLMLFMHPELLIKLNQFRLSQHLNNNNNKNPTLILNLPNRSGSGDINGIYIGLPLVTKFFYYFAYHYFKIIIFRIDFYCNAHSWSLEVLKEQFLYLKCQHSCYNSCWIWLEIPWLANHISTFFEQLSNFVYEILGTLINAFWNGMFINIKLDKIYRNPNSWSKKVMIYHYIL